MIPSGEQYFRTRKQRALFRAQPPDAAGHQVCVEVDAIHRWVLGATGDISTGDADTVAVRVLHDRTDVIASKLAWLAARKVMNALARIPSVISALHYHIHFFILILPNVAGPQFTCGAIEGHAPHVAQPVRPDFRARTGHSNERIVLGNSVQAVALRVININAQDLCKQ